MGKCKYCGKTAGILRAAHRDCSQRNSAGKKKIVDLVHHAASKAYVQISVLEKEIYSIADTGFIKEHEIRHLAYTGWQYAVIDAIKRKEFTDENYRTLRRLAQLNQLSQENIWASMIWSKFMAGRRWKFPEQVVRARKVEKNAVANGRSKQEVAERQRIRLKQEEVAKRRRTMLMSVIEDLSIGRFPRPNLPKEVTPFNFQKSEKLVWVFKNTTYQEKRVKKRRTHRSSGVSPTVYGMETVGTGTMGLTTRHIYFVSTRSQFRIRYNKIVTFSRCLHGIEIKRDSVNARTQRFITGEGWFTHELLKVLARRF
ncbi:MAG: hypothetical protein OXG84_00370 [Chloroflexi bacterium]|nr:hypothetical protein [Chloroflexota bacterium]